MVFRNKSPLTVKRAVSSYVEFNTDSLCGICVGPTISTCINMLVRRRCLQNLYRQFTNIIFYCTGKRGSANYKSRQGLPKISLVYPVLHNYTNITDMKDKILFKEYNAYNYLDNLKACPRLIRHNRLHAAWIPSIVLYSSIKV